MTNFMNKFLKEEDGAVTVDWVVLTAAIVGLGVAGISSVQSGVVGLAGKIGTAVDSDDWVGQGVGTGEE
ncbi:MAG: Flp family type IVb pilin [Roseovarius sp.]